jgi:anti-sigma regulatory factor (Ser/Thr protein kinase)
MKVDGDMQARFPNSLAVLPQLHAVVERFCRHCAIPPDTEFKIDLALEEVFTNIVRYGYDDGRSHEIAVRLRCVRGRVRIQIDDDGRRFNPLLAPEVDVDAALAERRPGGLGIHLVRRLLDEVRYQRRKTGNRLILVKRLATEEKRA